MEERKFYVYVYKIKPTNEVFYVGKGSGRRYKRIDKRSNSFKEMCDSHEYYVQIVQSHMTENEAFELEKLLISYYRKFTGAPLVNITDGGEGASGHRWSEEEKKRISERQVGEKTPNYGNYWTKEQREHLRNIQKNNPRYKRENNPNAKRIQCVETGEVFNCILDAKDRFHVNSAASFSAALKYPHKTAAGLHWRYLP